MTLGPSCFPLSSSPLAFFHGGSACSSFYAVFHVRWKIQGHRWILCYGPLFFTSRVSPPRAEVEVGADADAEVEVEAGTEVEVGAEIGTEVGAEVKAIFQA